MAFSWNMALCTFRKEDSKPPLLSKLSFGTLFMLLIEVSWIGFTSCW